MSDAILYIGPEELGLEIAKEPQRRAAPTAPWFIDNAALRDAVSGPLDRERRFRGALDQLMELFATSQVTPLEFRSRLLGLLAMR